MIVNKSTFFIWMLQFQIQDFLQGWFIINNSFKYFDFGLK